jgi:hypothetical protein
VSKERPIENGVDLLEDQATYRAYEDLIVIALDTGNVPGARLRFKEAEDQLSEFSHGELYSMALNDYGIDLR